MQRQCRHWPSGPGRYSSTSTSTCSIRLSSHLPIFCFNDTATTEIYTLSLHDALPISDLIAFVDTIGDMLVLFGVLAVLSRGTTHSSITALRIFAAGMIAFIANDLSYGYIVAHSTYLAGDPVDTLWVLAVIAIWLSLACQLRAEPVGGTATPPQPTFRRPSVVPYLAVACSYLLLIVIDRHTIRAGPQGVVLLGSILLTVLVSARQYVALRDYGRLADRYQELAAIDGMTGLYNRRSF